MQQIKAFRYYMEKYPNSFVGFLDHVADVLREVGQEWKDFAFTSQDKTCHAWSVVFLEAAETIDKLTVEMARIRDEHDEKFKSAYTIT